MSHHILHVFRHGAILGRERGFITCRAEGQDERRLPLDDVRAVIIAARGVTLTSSFLSGVMETDGIVLHCDERYQPCGWTAPLARVVDLRTFQHQTARPRRLNEPLWHEMLRGKTLNQSRVLEHKRVFCWEGSCRSWRRAFSRKADSRNGFTANEAGQNGLAARTDLTGLTSLTNEKQAPCHAAIGQ
jgi:CRISPR/Cas system-associated endonuclease Cas1